MLKITFGDRMPACIGVYHLVSPCLCFRIISSNDNLHFGRVGTNCHDQTPFKLNEVAVHYYLVVVLA